MGVPREKAGEVLDRIANSARSVGFLEQIKEKTYVSLQGTSVSPAVARSEEEEFEEANESAIEVPSVSQHPPAPAPTLGGHGTALAAAIADDERRRKVFITHGKNRDLVDPIKIIRRLIVIMDEKAVVYDQFAGKSRGCCGLGLDSAVDITKTIS